MDNIRLSELGSIKYQTGSGDALSALRRVSEPNEESS